MALIKPCDGEEELATSPYASSRNQSTSQIKRFLLKKSRQLLLKKSRLKSKKKSLNIYSYQEYKVKTN